MLLLPFKSIKLEKKQPNLEHLKRRNSSRIRDHLANERTYLAWMRTAISLMGFGVVIVRLRFFKPPLTMAPGNGWKLGLIFSLVGLVTVLLSTYHYFAVRHDIDEDTYEPSDRWVLIFSLAVVLLGAGIIYYVFTLPLSPINTLVFE
jgi:putative membrane protein